MKHGDLLAAYFTMEAGFYSELKTYSGGLGILAGDYLKSAADMRIPISAVTPLYQYGYFDQKIDNKRQIEEYNKANNIEFMTELPYTVDVEIEGRNVKVGCARMKYVGNTNFAQPQYFIFTKGNDGRPWDDNITDKLYKTENSDPQKYWRIAQEQILGIGGVRMLHLLADAGELNLPSIYHLNEGHAAFAPVELMKQYGIDEVKKKTVFTTHTPIAAGHDRFNYDKVYSMLGRYLNGVDIKALAGYDHLNMTQLALNLSKYANAVAIRHGIVSSKMFPDYKIDSITNGVHSRTWTTRIFKKLYDEHFNGTNYPDNWRSNPKLLEGIDKVSNDAVLRAHKVAKINLLDYVNKKTGDKLDEDKLTIGFARRFTPYKRGDLIFSELERLIDASGNGQVQFIFSGKAHPNDEEGKNVINNVLNNAEKLKDKVKIVFLPNYEMDKAQLLVSGVDLWLNLPRRPLEASGTSGMKAAHNGVPSFSTIDGWWDEVPKEQNGERRGGWSIGNEPSDNEFDNVCGNKKGDTEDFNNFCYRLKNDVLPAFNDSNEWARVMKGAIKNASYFNTHRMVQEYVEKAYGISLQDAIVK
jgi:starch phosphorylase